MGRKRTNTSTSTSTIVTSTSAAPAPTLDVEALARAQRVARADTCTQEVFDAITPILKRHNCRLVIRQQYTDGQPGPVSIGVAAMD